MRNLHYISVIYTDSADIRKSKSKLNLLLPVPSLQCTVHCYSVSESCFCTHYKCV